MTCDAIQEPNSYQTEADNELFLHANHVLPQHSTKPRYFVQTHYDNMDIILHVLLPPFHENLH